MKLLFVSSKQSLVAAKIGNAKQMEVDAVLKQLEPASKLVATMKIFRHIEMLTASMAAETLEEFAAIVLGRGDQTASRDFFKFIAFDFKKHYDLEAQSALRFDFEC